MVKTAFQNIISFLIDSVSYVFHFFAQNEFLSVVLGSFIFLFFLNLLVSFINSRGKTITIKPLRVSNIFPFSARTVTPISMSMISPMSVSGVRGLNSVCIEGIGSTPVKSNASGSLSFTTSSSIGASLASVKSQKDKEKEIQAAEIEKQQADKEYWNYQYLLNNSSGQAKKEIKQAWIDKHLDKHKDN